MRTIPTRALLVVSTFLLSVLLYVDRACISTAKDAVTAELGLSELQWSWVLASFAFGYALLQTPSGALADRLGGRAVLTAVVAAWSIFTGLTASVRGFLSLLAIRFCFGAGEAGAFPGMARVVYSWIPVQERGLVKGINFSGSRIGAALAMPVVSAMIAGMGWKQSFVVLMVLGFAWAMIWWWWFRDEPAEHRGVSVEEMRYILHHRQQTEGSHPTEPLRPARLLGSGNLWLMMIQYFGSNFTFFFSLTWLYPYVKSRYGLTGRGCRFLCDDAIVGRRVWQRAGRMGGGSAVPRWLPGRLPTVARHPRFRTGCPGDGIERRAEHSGRCGVLAVRRHLRRRHDAQPILVVLHRYRRTTRRCGQWHDEYGRQPRLRNYSSGVCVSSRVRAGERGVLLYGGSAERLGHHLLAAHPTGSEDLRLMASVRMTTTPGVT